MPWKETDPVDERMMLVTRRLDGERMTDLCKEFGVSRKTGNKLWSRYRQYGPEGLFDLPRAPKRIPHQTPPELVKLIVEARKKHPTWGPKKLRAWLSRHHEDVRLPVPSTIGDILRREGLAKPHKAGATRRA